MSSLIHVIRSLIFLRVPLKWILVAIDFELEFENFQNNNLFVIHINSRKVPFEVQR